jgi:hypothetical protein
MTPILFARHGGGAWVPTLVAPSLAKFLFVVTKWIEVALDQYGGNFLDDEYALLPEVEDKIRAEWRRELSEQCVVSLVESLLR